MRPATILALAFLILAGPAAAQNINPVPVPTYREVIAMPVPVIDGDINDHPYVVVGRVNATAAKLTVFSRNPSDEILADKLWANARKLGAQAVLNTKFGPVQEGGMTHAQRKAEGQAVRFLTPAEIEAWRRH